MALRKYSTTFLKATSATDSRQTPAASASVEVYRQGAKVTAAVPVLTSATLVNVRSTGAVVVNDTLQAGTDTTKRFTVTAVTSATSLTMTANGGSTINLATNDRLVVVSAPLPILYDNDSSTGTPLANPATADSQGYIEFYTPDSPFDLIVRLSGMSPEVYEDQESGVRVVAGVSRSDYFNVMDYADVATALSEIPAGARLYFPAEEGPFTPPSAAGWTIEKPVTIYSDGPDVGEDLGFQYYNSAAAANKNSTVFTITPTAVRGVRFQDLVISNNAGMPAVDGTGDAIRVSGSGTLTYLSIDNCWLLYAGRSGIFSYDGVTPTNLARLTINNSRVQSCGGHGLALYGAHGIKITGSNFLLNGGMGAVISSCGNGVSIDGASDFESNGSRLAASGASDPTTPEDFGLIYNAQLYFAASKGIMVHSCNIEETASINPTYAKIGITLNACSGAVIGGNHITNGAAAAGSIGIRLIGGCTGCVIQPNNIGNMAAAVSVYSFAAETGNVIFPQGVVTADATAPGTIQLNAVAVASANRNWIFATNISASINDVKGVGLVSPMMASADLAAGILQEGLIFYEDTSDQVRVRKAASTTAVP